jgi:hypothetical protein
MKPKYLFQIIVLFAVLFSAFGTSQQAQAQTPVPVVMPALSYWNAIYTGFVDTSRYEKWPVTFDATYSFIVTATPSTDGFTPLLLLLDGNGNEISRSVGSLTSTQGTGSYFIQVQPSIGTGSYSLTIRKTTLPPSGVSTVVNPKSILVGATATVTVSLNNIPIEGYTSAEFTCTYDRTLVTVSTIVADITRFGADPAVATNDPQNGTFIIAIAGSSGKKATINGAAFTFVVTGVKVGVSAIECKARASKDGITLTDIPSTGDSLTVGPIVVNGTVTGKVTLPDQVRAGKVVTVCLLKADNSPVVPCVPTNADGTFSLTAPAATYKLLASAAGFLSAGGTAGVDVILTAGNTTPKSPTVLLAGDVDNNGIINVNDSQTIAINYNTATVLAADLNNDGTINVLDLELFARNYRTSSPLTGPVNWP